MKGTIIVGNGPIEGDQAEFIDSFETVIRLNGCHGYGSYAGKKTTILARHYQNRTAPQAVLDSVGLRIWDPYSADDAVKWVKIYAKENPKRLEPSLGYKVMYYLLAEKPELEPIYIIGFSWEGNEFHNWEYERGWFAALELQGRVHICRSKKQIQIVASALDITVMTVIRDMYVDLAPHFFRHYAKYGAGRFVFAVENGKDNPAWEGLPALNNTGLPLELHPISATGISSAKEDTQFYKMFCGEWYIPTDLDEFHVVEELNFPQLVTVCNAMGYDHVKSWWNDRIPMDGHIRPSIDPDIDIFMQFPRTYSIMDNVMKQIPNKVCLVRKGADLSDGHHLVRNGKPYPRIGWTYHFAWFGKLVERTKIKLAECESKGQTLYAEGLKRFLAHIEAKGGKLT